MTAKLTAVALALAAVAAVLAADYQRQHRVDTLVTLMLRRDDNPARILVCQEYRRWAAQAGETVDGMEEQCR